MGLLFWTLDGLIAGGGVLEDVDGNGVRRYRLIGSTGLAGSPHPAGVPRVDLDARQEAESRSAFAVGDMEQPPPSAERGDVVGVRLRGSLSLATRQLSLRARVSFTVTSRAQGRDPK